MERIILIIGFFCCASCFAQNPSLSVNDLVSLSSLSPNNFDEFIIKKGFPVKRRSLVDNSMGFTFYQAKPVTDSFPVNRTVDLYKKDDTWCLEFHTTSREEYLDLRNRLKKLNFYFNQRGDTSSYSPLLFQKKAITIQARIDSEETEPVYSFLMTKKEIPDPSSIRFADDLLRFDSHEYLVSCYGENNVKKDTYIFSPTETKRCSVLFPNTDQQAVFIWENESEYRKISYVLISGTLSTPDSKQFSGSFSHNKWELKNGIYPGMRISDLLRLNSNDFKFYGNQSEYSMMVEPKVTGSLNFKWIGIGFNCFNCDRSGILDKQKVSASDAVNNNLAMHVSCIMITP